MESVYETMFGEAKVGRPVGTGTVRAGDPALTESARRRAKRILVELHSEEFEELFEAELEYLESVAVEAEGS